MIQFIVLMALSTITILLTAATCTINVKEEVKSLSQLKTECDNLQIELESLGAKKWTKGIDAKVKACKDHGFWAARLKNFDAGF